jgi:hypothetical protein
MSCITSPLAIGVGTMVFPLRPLWDGLGAAVDFASVAAFFSSSLLAFLAFDFLREKSAMVSAKSEGLSSYVKRID